MSKQRTNPQSRAAEKKVVQFHLESPNAKAVQVTGTFSDWQARAVPLKKERKGSWSACFPLDPGRYEYRFFVDGEWLDDLNCGERVANPFGTQNCILNVVREQEQAVHALQGSGLGP